MVVLHLPLARNQDAAAPRAPAVARQSARDIGDVDDGTVRTLSERQQGAIKILGSDGHQQMAVLTVANRTSRPLRAVTSSREALRYAIYCAVEGSSCLTK